MKYLVFIIIFVVLLSFVFSFFNNNDTNIDNLSSNFYDYSVELINGEKLDFNKLKGKKIIIVNVASKCGYTPQYSGLQKLYEKFNNEIEIIGFPANDFLWQEPGKNKDIQTFCNVNYGVTFPLVEKSVVKKNKDQHPLFSWLSHKDLNGWNDAAPGWNFYKYLVDEEGRLISVHSSKIKPFDEQILNFIDSKSSNEAK